MAEQAGFVIVAQYFSLWTVAQVSRKGHPRMFKLGEINRYSNILPLHSSLLYRRPLRARDAGSLIPSIAAFSMMQEESLIIYWPTPICTSN